MAYLKAYHVCQFQLISERSISNTRRGEFLLFSPEVVFCSYFNKSFIGISPQNLKVHSSVSFAVFTEMGNHDHYLVSEHFHHSRNTLESSNT